MNIITAHFLSRIFTSFRNSTIHAVAMYAFTVLFCGDQYLAPQLQNEQKVKYRTWSFLNRFIM
jgi:hypothetical protein